MSPLTSTNEIENIVLYTVTAVTVTFVVVTVVVIYHCFVKTLSKGKSVRFAPMITFLHSMTDFITDLMFGIVVYLQKNEMAQFMYMYLHIYFVLDLIYFSLLWQYIG